jgi:hypothetical protein
MLCCISEEQRPHMTGHGLALHGLIQSDLVWCSVVRASHAKLG